MTNLYDELKVSIALAGATSLPALRNITLVKKMESMKNESSIARFKSC